MAYAANIKGKVEIFGELPKSYHSKVSNVLGGFDKLPNEELEKHGFYPVVEPNITDPLFQEKGELVFDESKKVYIYKIEEKIHPDVEILKRIKLKEIDRLKKTQLDLTQDIVLESLELGKPIPEYIKKHRASIRERFDNKIIEVGNLNNKRDLLTLVIQ